MKKITLFIGLLTFALSVSAQTSGGPDAYGYTWKNSNHTTSPPSYNWVDISAKGTEVTTLADDNIAGPFSIPSGFQFYWYPITEFWIGSNGYVSFDGDNIASPFPAAIPAATGANNFIAMHMADLKFDGAGNPGKCYYYATNDSLVVSFIDVPYWVVASPGYSGSNTFQVVVSSIDKSIKINYQNMSAGSTPLPIDNAVGIENNTGALGLGAMIDVVPTNNFAIEFTYPSTVTYAVTDGGINWNNNPADGGYFISVSNLPFTLKSNVKNFGNQNISSFVVTDTMYAVGSGAISNGSDTVTGLIPGEDTTITFSNVFYAQFARIHTFSSRVMGITGDLVLANDRKTQKIISVDTKVPQYILDYSDGSPDGTGLGWNGGNGGIAVYIEPPVYPAKIDGAQYYISANGVTPVGFSAMIYDDSGPNGTPGVKMDSVFVPGTNVTVGAYNTVQFNNDSIFIPQGGFYLVWYMEGPDINIARDLTPPISARSFEILGNAWAGYRSKLTEDFLMGALVSAAPKPEANFGIDSSMVPTFTFADSSNNNPDTWLWDFGFNNDTSSLQNPTYTYTANGSYQVCLTASNYVGGSTVCKTVHVRNIGLEENIENLEIKLYPNPAGNWMMVDLPEGLSFEQLRLEVFNAQGQVLQVPVNVNGQEVVLKTSALANGMYILKLTINNNAEQTLNHKFMIKH